MTKSILLSALCAFAFGANATVKSGTFTVPANETHVLTSAENVHGQEIVLLAGSTLKLPENAGDFTLKPFVKLSGAATLDTGDATSLVVDGGLWATSASCRLTVSGLGEFAFGRDNDGTWDYSDDLYARIDITSVAFPAGSAAKIVLTNDVASFALPAADVCDVEIAKGARVIGMGENQNGLKRFVKDAVLTVSGWSAIHGRSDGVSLYWTIRVASDGAYYMMPRILHDDWYLNEFGVVATSSVRSFAETVELAKGALLGLRVYGTGAERCFAPKVSGSGTMRFFADQEAGQTATLGARISGLLKSCPDFTGDLIVEDAFNLSFASPMSIGSLTISDKSTITAADGPVSRELKVGSLTADSVANVIGFTQVTVTGSCGEGAKFVAESDGDFTYDLSAASGTYPELVAYDGMRVDVKSPATGAVPLTPLWNPKKTDWRSKVLMRFDPSDESTLVYYKDSHGQQVYYTNSLPLLVGIHDPGNKTANGYALASLRGVNADGTPNLGDEHRETCPYLVPGGLNGLNYLCFGPYYGNTISDIYGKESGTGSRTVNEARRAELRSWTQSSKTFGTGQSAVAAQYAILVFGSQQGGGNAILGVRKDDSTKGILTRGSGAKTLEKPLIAASDFATRIDGSEVDATQGGLLKGGWQIISVALNGNRFDGVGLNSTYSDAGGQNYAEIVIFKTMPTEEERAACERYLAQKWGLESSYQGSRNPSVQLDGGGAHVLASDIRIVGGYHGTVEVPDGKTLELPAYNPVPGEEAVVSENRIGWYDPSCPGAVLQKFSGITAPMEDVGLLLSRDENGPIDAADAYLMAGYYDGGTDRCPWTNWTARGVGPAMPWMDFRDSPDVLAAKPNGNGGNALRSFKGKSTSRNGGDTGITQMPDAREAYLAVDSSRGGGNVLGANCSSIAWSAIWPGARGQQGLVVTNAILTKTTTDYDDAAVRLDDKAINGKVDGYNGRPEILTLTTTKAFKPNVLGLYEQPDATGRYQAEIIGESVFYSRPLSDEARNRLTAYLARKWFGRYLDGYTDVSGATVTGAGRVALRQSNAVGLPSLASFTGTFDCQVTALAFTAKEDGTVADGIAVPQGTVDLSAVETVTVTAEGGAFQPGRYVLASGTSIVYGADLTLTAVGTVPSNHRLRFEKNADSLVLNVELKPGLMIILK